MLKCLFLQDLEGLTEVFGRMSAGTSGRKLPLWADFSFLIRVQVKSPQRVCSFNARRLLGGQARAAGEDSHCNSSDECGDASTGCSPHPHPDPPILAFLDPCFFPLHFSLAFLERKPLLFFPKPCFLKKAWVFKNARVLGANYFLHLNHITLSPSLSLSLPFRHSMLRP